jgi:hypothetical protein
MFPSWPVGSARQIGAASQVCFAVGSARVGGIYAPTEPASGTTRAKDCATSLSESPFWEHRTVANDQPTRGWRFQPKETDHEQ